MRVRKLYTAGIVVTAVLFLCLCIFFLSYDYNSLVRQIIATSGKPYLEDILRNRVFTQSKFYLLRYVCFALLAFIPVAEFLLIFYRDRILSFSKKIWQKLWQNVQAVRQVFYHNTRRENISIILMLLVVTIRSGYYLIHYDLQYDEMWCYNYFTAQPFYYPFVVSSNYPLYEVSTQVFKWLPFDMKINLRLPVLIAGLFSCVLIYACLRKWFANHVVAWGGMILFAFMPVSTFFMLYARGVMFCLFFSIMTIFSILFWLRNGQQKRYLLIYVFASAAGFYSMPTYVYVWLLLFLFSFVICLVKYRTQAISLLLANTSAAVLSLLLYLPFIAGSGLSFLLDASAAMDNEPISLHAIQQYTNEVSYFFTGSVLGLAGFLIIAFLVVLISKQWQKHIRLFILCSALCVLPTLIYAMQGIWITPRALAFTGLAIPLLFSVILSVNNKKRPAILLPLLIVITGCCAAFISSRHNFFTWSITQDKETKKLSALFLQHHITTCYDNSGGSDFFYYHPAIEYYYRMANQTFNLSTSMDNSLRYKPFSLADQYDCVVYHTTDSVAGNSYHKWMENKKEGFIIYLHNGK